MTPYLVAISTASTAEAEAIARAMVEGRLAAAANVVPGIRSLYRWRGEIHQAAEAMVVLKTHGDLVGEILTRVKALHSYASPSIVAWPIAAANPDTIDWIGRETDPGTAFV